MGQAADRRGYQNVGASKQAIQHHYDVGNALYERFLGPTMAYSAAIWNEPASRDTLDDAQNRKLDWHIDWSGAGSGTRLLEVGCGWGSIVKRMGQRNPKAEIVGLTLSDAQAAFIRAHHGTGPEVHVMPWQDFRANKPFHSIISIEAIEHFAAAGLTRDQRIAAYRNFFEFCARNLVPGGRMTVQASVWHNVEPADEWRYDFSHFFPESCLPHVFELVAGAEPQFHVARLEDNARDFVYTLREWVKRLRREEAALTHQFGAKVVRTYIENFSTFIQGHLVGATSLCRLALERRGATVVRPVRDAGG
jgi:cyclopropane-fatty-acyl-phospholipid synthase